MKAADGRGTNWDRWLFVLATVALLIRLGFWLWPVVDKPEEKEAKVETKVESIPSREKPLPVPVEMEPECLPVSLPVPLPAPELSRPPSPLPEEFHFRQTRWGMSLEEVRAAEPSIPIQEDNRGLLYSVTTLELPSLVN